MGKVVVTSAELAKFETSAAKLRKELLTMPLMSVQDFLKHVSLRPGIRYSESVGELTGTMEVGPYSKTRIDDDDVEITPRTLYTYFGSVVKKFDPNSVYQSIWGSNITKGEGLKNTDITQQVLAFLSKKVGDALYFAQWNAKRNPTGDKTVDLFDGFDTIAEKEITDGKLSVGNGNLYDLDISTIDKTNAVDTLKDIWRKADYHLKRQKCKLFVTPEILDAYNDDYKITTGAIAYNTQFNQTFVEGSGNMCEIVALPNKAGSKFMQLTTKQNMLVGVNQMTDEETVAVEKHEAFILQFIMTLFWGCQYESIKKERLLVIGKDKTATAPEEPGGGSGTEDGGTGDGQK